MCIIVMAAPPTIQGQTRYFIIKIIDEETGRGVPLVELKTTNSILLITDSRGIIAFNEPGLMNQRVFFYVSSHGYDYRGRVFDAQGITLTTTPGDSATIRITRTNIAERLYRITGQGIYDQSILAGQSAPLKQPVLNGQVMGQDTFIETVHKGKIYWFWGDTDGPADFNGSASGATSELPDSGGLDPSVGVDLTYFVDSTGFSKPMCPIRGPGLVWIDWLVTIPDGNGDEKLYGKFSRTKTLDEDYERGIAVFNDSLKLFEKVVRVDAWLDKVHSSGHPVRVRADGREYIYIIDRYGFERVIADSQHITNAASYEHFTCLATGAKFDSAASALDRNAEGQLTYSWKQATDPLSQKQQVQLVSSGKITRAEGLWQAQDIESGRPIAIVPGSVFWNDYHKCWVMLAYEWCGSVWYLEGDTPVGPWVFGQKIVSHESYDFYNVGQHPLFDQDGGRIIYFEGTYTTGFSGNTNATPLYDYNQIMYCLSLDDSRLSLPAPVYRVRDVQGRERYLMRAAVDSLNLWDRILEIPFYAIPSDRTADQVIPVYSQSDKNCDKFIVDRPAGRSDSPCFYALPAASLPPAVADPITGTWQCTATTSDGLEESFELELTLRNRTVSGDNVTKGIFRDGKLDLQIHESECTITGALKDGRLFGDFMKDDSTMGGIWTGQRVKLPHERLVSSAIVPLYEYLDKTTGLRFYSVGPGFGSDSVKRSEKPLCRVWKNPSSLLLLDYQARPDHFVAY